VVISFALKKQHPKQSAASSSARRRLKRGLCSICHFKNSRRFFFHSSSFCNLLLLLRPPRFLSRWLFRRRCFIMPRSLISAASSGIPVASRLLPFSFPGCCQGMTKERQEIREKEAESCKVISKDSLDGFGCGRRSRARISWDDEIAGERRGEGRENELVLCACCCCCCWLTLYWAGG
jgi:hypothetical protein